MRKSWSMYIRDFCSEKCGSRLDPDDDVSAFSFNQRLLFMAFSLSVDACRVKSPDQGNWLANCGRESGVSA